MLRSPDQGRLTAEHDRRPPAPPARPARQGLARSARLFRLFRQEQTEPDLFYSGVAADAVAQLSRYTELAGRTVVDIGGGAGYFSAALRAAGAESFIFEPDRTELLKRGAAPPGAILADGYWLPVADASADICFSSNVLEHVPDPAGLIAEMIRVIKPGGLIYLSFTNWYSPWGGHEMSPWHLLGADFAARRYLRKYGRLPKHKVGQNLYRVHVGPTLRQIRARDDVEIVDQLPRYYPRWCRFIVRLPWLRELVTWNLLVIARRTT